MKVKDLLFTVSQTIVDVKCFTILIYIEAFEIFKPIGFLGILLMLTNIKYRQKDDSAKNTLHNVLFCFILIFSFMSDPSRKAVELCRLQCISFVFQKRYLLYSKDRDDMSTATSLST